MPLDSKLAEYRHQPPRATQGAAINVALTPTPPPAASVTTIASLASTMNPDGGVISIVRSPVRKGQEKIWPVLG